MAKCCQPKVSNSIWPGIVISIILISITVVIFSSLLFFFSKIRWEEFIYDGYLFYVIKFTFIQASISTGLAIIPAIFLAKALFRRHFLGRKLLLHLCSITLVLPVLVTILGLLTVYGRMGWIFKLCNLLGINYNFTPYGLKGIVLAHIFFNFPLASKILLFSLENISVEQRQLAAQLGMNQWHIFCIIEWPYLRRQILPICTLIFMLCFTSFATVLILGGGPNVTTIALAIYQSLSYDFDLNKAAVLALIQLFFCLSVALLNQNLNIIISVGNSHNLKWKHLNDSNLLKLWDTLIISITIIFLIPPLLAIIIDSLNFRLLQVLHNIKLLQAFTNSILISINSGILCVICTVMLLWSIRELRLRHSIFFCRILEVSGLLIFSISDLVLATGLFLLLHNFINLSYLTYSLLILTNALMAIPYAFKILENPMYDLAERYNLLCISLNIKGINRFNLIELKSLKKTIGQAFSFACMLSIGDFGVISLFGNENFLTLPYYLYQQLSSYRNNDAAVTVLIILLLCFSLFILIKYLSGKKYD
ncbi:Sulfate transport system permease protein CysW [Candidatus Arsenophonus lipoptenae]|uniref:Thiamine transport system permease protein ThiP n=1 Tax=Candidatus Arsenophonus lipoptenae TaxID=634113 RepID=A0A120HPV9_9GAMM|nr:thiamine/thiamine pyrophosphate ABC transporter permease [Candidatus Arsenophonus lipoptenae]AMA64966.1 Sulfate transport system permease protein CysW [Candidatus Arsenophonus lipoptenae]